MKRNNYYSILEGLLSDVTPPLSIASVVMVTVVRSDILIESVLVPLLLLGVVILSRQVSPIIYNEMRDEL